MREFGLIKNIDIDDPKTWETKIFITTDIDWACDGVIQFCSELFSKNKIKVTWFATHQTSELDKIRSNSDYELGIHPNFNPLLMNGSYEKGANAHEIIHNLKSIVPEAVSIRSHSITQSSQLLSIYEKFNLKYDLNTFINLDKDLIIKPFKYYFNTIKLPYIWQDDTFMDGEMKSNVDLEIIRHAKGLIIINFHPIHLFLNCENMERYNKCKPFYQNYKELSNMVNNNSYGIRNFFDDLCKLVN